MLRGLNRDLAYEDWLDWYNFNAPEGCSVDFPDKGDVRLPNVGGNDSRRGDSASACATGFVGDIGFQ